MSKINLKNFEIMNIINALNGEDSIRNAKDVSISWDVLWQLDKNYEVLSNLNSQCQDMVQKIQSRYLDENKTVTEENGSIRIADEYMAEYQGEMNDLMNADNEIEISQVDIHKMLELSTSPRYYMQLKFMLFDSESENETENEE